MNLLSNVMIEAYFITQTKKYENDIDAFISFINDESLAVKGSYADGWKYILKRNQESLHRHSNMHQIIKEHIGYDHVSEDENEK